MYNAKIVQVVKNICTCTKNINKFPLKTNLIHQQMVVKARMVQLSSALSPVENLLKGVGSNNVIKATPKQYKNYNF